MGNPKRAGTPAREKPIHSLHDTPRSSASFGAVRAKRERTREEGGPARSDRTGGGPGSAQPLAVDNQVQCEWGESSRGEKPRRASAVVKQGSLKATRTDFQEE